MASNRQEGRRTRLREMDLWLAGTALALTAIGLVMVFSASAPIAMKNYGDPGHYALRNLIFAVVGIISAALLSQLTLKGIRDLARVGFWVCILLMVVVLIPGVGLEGGGARRWIGAGGITLQPSEPFKLMMVLFVAHLLERDPGRVRRIKGGLLPLMMLFGVAATLLMAEPDFGTTLISGTVLLGMVFVAGIPYAWIVFLVVAAIPAAAAGVMMAPYRFQRVISFWDPWDDPLNSDFQLAQSLISFGSGGLGGAGLGQGTQKQFYLPESHTDFIFAVIGEELGLVWVLLVIALFAVLVWRGFVIARNSPDSYVRLGSAGLAMLLGTQALANMGVVMGLLPPKGLTLPLVSYGGSSLVITLSVVGLLLAFSRTLPGSGAARSAGSRE
ncbi:MAG: putative lipid II flippase FtsW [Magnetococcales bacterium]|nr:putative lipid II flippase FtsW [Magnetococcales bacterium]